MKEVLIPSVERSLLMIDLDTFVTWLYVEVDDFCKSQLPPERHPGPPATLSRSEVMTLALVSQWSRFDSERRSYAELRRQLRWAFPHMPHRTQFNRLLRRYGEALTRFALARYEASPAYEVLDSTGARTRNARRRGRGWLVGHATKGWC